MTIIQKTIIFLNYFGVGVFAPVLSLFLLERGCNMRNLSIVIGIYSAMVIAAEVPSGMIADLYGRKRAYYISAASTFGSYIIMYYSTNLPVLILGIVLFGVGVAFLSGSLDSLIIEDCICRNGKERLSEVTGSLLIYQCEGIACGSLLCAILPNKGGYLPHIVVRLSVLLLSTLLCAIFLKEGGQSTPKSISFRKQMQTVISYAKGHRAVQIVLLCIFGSSVSLFALETYWQPQFSELITQRQNYLLGLLCAVGYGGNLLGSFLASRIKLTEAKKSWGCYLLCTTCLGCGLLALAFQRNSLCFMLCYAAIMTLLGIANVPEQTILNSEASNEIRSSLLSIASFASKLSGVFSSAICTALIVPIKISGIWLLMGSFTLFVAVIAAIWLSVWKYNKHGLSASGPTHKRQKRAKASRNH